MKTLIAIPCMDMVHTLFAKSVMTLQLRDQVEVSFASGSLIYDARNKLAMKAVEEGFDRVLWLDSDMVFDPDLFPKLANRLDEGYSFVSGLYFKRKAPIAPVIYERCDLVENEAHETIPVAKTFDDYPKDQLFEIKAAGFGGVMMTTELIDKVHKKYGLPFFPVAGFGEDLAFCYRCQMAGEKMYCDSSIKLKHIGLVEIGEETFQRGR